MIKIENLSLNFKNFNLSNVNLFINTGESHVIVGPTGSGKTLLLECIVGFKKPDKGKIFVFENDVTDLPPNLRKISYVPQDICLFLNMTVEDNISYSLRFIKGDKKEYINRLNDLVDFFKISHLLKRFPINLSGGERQRVALVRALVFNPSLLVLDEPFSAIDYSMREEVIRMIKKMHKELKITMLMVTHSFEEAYFIADNITVIMNGKIIHTDNAYDMYNYPKNESLAIFLGIKNIFNGTITNVEPHHIIVSWDNCNNIPIKINCQCALEKFKVNQKIKWGIRQEAIKILNNNNTNFPPKDNVINVNINEIHQRGKFHTLVCATENDQIIEIDVHNTAAYKLDIFNATTLQVSFNPNHIFIIN